MMRVSVFCLALGLLGAPASAQEAAKPERMLKFAFKAASVDAVLQYVAKEMGWTLVYGVAKPDVQVTAWSDAEVPESRIQDFLNSALSRARVQVLVLGGVLKVVSEEDAKKGTFNIDYGDDPAKVPITDTVRTWIMPLRNANVVDVNKELGEILKSDGLTTAVNTYSNTVILSGRGSSIHRVVRILKIIDVQAAERLEVKMFKLKHADATETARLLNEVFKREQTMTGGGGGGSPWQEMARAFMGGGRRGGGEGGGGQAGPVGRTLASEVLRITADVRTNAVIATTTTDNMKLIEGVITDLDREAAAALRLKLYPLRYADARDAAALITAIFTDETTQARQAQRSQQRLPVWMGGGAPSPGDEPTGASREVRAVADLRSNSVVVAANETNLQIIDELIDKLDRQLMDVLRIKVYELKNAEASSMAQILRDIFRPQVNATQSAGRSTGAAAQQQQGGGGFGQFLRMMGQQGGAVGGLPPSQEVEITADTRTNSVIAKASEEYIAIMDQVVAQLDQNPTESTSTYVLPLNNADAANLAQVLRDLMRGTGGGTGGARTTTIPGLNTQNRGTTGPRTTTGAQGGGARHLGPLEPQDPAEGGPIPLPQEDDEARRGIQGQVDVQADPQTNALVIRTSPRNFEAIQNIVKGLDRMRPQVLIKVLIAEVTLDDEFRFGVEWSWENKFRVKGDAITQKYGTDFNLFGQGATATFTGDEISATLNAFAEDGRLKVLATPRILVLDNQSATISIGKSVPRVTNSTINDLGNTVNTVQYRDVGILLDVTPHINFDGLVTMKVHPEISDRAPESESVQITEGVTSPTFNVNYADTTVAARNGQTVVIGGLIRESSEETVQKVPLLGDIPLLGALFSNTTEIKVRRELMIFLTPYVAYTSSQLEELAELEKSKLKLLDYRELQDEQDQWLKRLKR